jgi:hypothetical protein
MNGSLAAMTTTRLRACGFVALAVLCGCQRNVSGTYLASDPNALEWLQLVRTPENRLTGQLVLFVIKPDGQIDRNSVPLAGAVDGDNVTLSGGGLFGLQMTFLSGTIAGDTLTLTGPQSQPTVLKRSSSTTYQAQVNLLNGRAQAILAARAAALSQKENEEDTQKFVTNVDRLINDMQQFESEADVHLTRFPNVEKGYLAITAKMAEYVARERQLGSKPNSSNTRSQLANAVNQAVITTDQAHNQGQALKSTLETNVRPIANELAAFYQRCHDGVSNFTPAEREARTSACARLLDAAPAFQKKYDATTSGLAHLEQVYKKEWETQQGLLRISDKLQ